MSDRRPPRYSGGVEIHVSHLAEPVMVVGKCCEHVNTEPVADVTGELVARLCLDCDAQLDLSGNAAAWPEPNPLGTEALELAAAIQETYRQMNASDCR